MFFKTLLTTYFNSSRNIFTFSKFAKIMFYMSVYNHYNYGFGMMNWSEDVYYLLLKGVDIKIIHIE